MMRIYINVNDHDTHENELHIFPPRSVSILNVGVMERLHNPRSRQEVGHLPQITRENAPRRL